MLVALSGRGSPYRSSGRDRGGALPRELIGAGLLSVGIGLILILGLLIDRSPFAFDVAILKALRAWGRPGWLPNAARDVTALGGGVILTLVVVVTAGLLMVQRHWIAALATIAASASGGYAVDLLKGVLVRSRPDVVPHLVDVTGYSFPSGHATSSAVVYLTLAALAGQVTDKRAVRRYLFIVAAVLVATIGASRVYLGVHWPSDVMAGWCFGTLWAIGWWMATARARTALRGYR